MKNFRDLINKWGTQADLARDIGVPYETVRSMYFRNSIKTKYWGKVIKAAKRRGIKSVTEKKLVQLKAGRAAVENNETA